MTDKDCKDFHDGPVVFLGVPGDSGKGVNSADADLKFFISKMRNGTGECFGDGLIGGNL